jgi:hypothetical protein
MSGELDVRDAVLDWQPQMTYEPRWQADRAGEFRARWREAAVTALPQKELA